MDPRNVAFSGWRIFFIKLWKCQNHVFIQIEINKTCLSNDDGNCRKKLKFTICFKYQFIRKSISVIEWQVSKEETFADSKKTIVNQVMFLENMYFK